MKPVKNAFEIIDSKLNDEQVKQSETMAEEMLLRYRLQKIHEEMGLDQSTFEAISEENNSATGNRNEMKVSTLKEYCNALGLEMEIIVRSKDKNAVQKNITLLKS